MDSITGKIEFNGKETTCRIEIQDKEIVLHLPKNRDTSNWYHAVYIKKDL